MPGEFIPAGPYVPPGGGGGGGTTVHGDLSGRNAAHQHSGSSVDVTATFPGDDDPSTVTLNVALADLIASIGTGGGTGPTIPFANGDDWAALVDQLRPGMSIEVIGTDAEVPAGEWDLNGAGFVGEGVLGIGPNGNSTLTFQEGASIINPARRLASQCVELVSASSAPVYVAPATVTSIYLDDDALLSSLDAPFILVPNGASLLCSVSTGSGFLTGENVLRVDTGGFTYVVYAYGNTSMADDTISADGTVIILIVSPAGPVPNPFGPAQGLSHTDAPGLGIANASRAPYIDIEPISGLGSTVQTALANLKGLIDSYEPRVKSEGPTITEDAALDLQWDVQPIDATDGSIVLDPAALNGEGIEQVLVRVDTAAGNTVTVTGTFNGSVVDPTIGVGSSLTIFGGATGLEIHG